MLYGREALCDAELLGLVLGGGNAVLRAACLLRDFGGLEGLASGLPQELCASPGIGTAGATAITEHDGGDLGTLAVTVAHEGSLRNYYPLAPEGSNALHAEITRLGIAHQGLSFPGRVCIDRERRGLAADCG